MKITSASNIKYLNWFIKTAILLVLTVVIYNQIVNRPDLAEVYRQFQESMSEPNWIYLIGIVLLVPFNWVFETFKWRTFMNRYLKLPFFQSLKVILSGITVAILTPNRIGEYGGRLLTIPAENNWHSIIATFIGSVAQNLVTLFLGLVSFYYLKDYIPSLTDVDLNPVYLAGAAFLIGALYIFFNVDILAYTIKKLGLKPFFSRFQRHFRMIRDTPRNSLLKILLISFLRYGIYASQYYLAVRFFDVEIDPSIAFACISTILLIQSGIPLPPFLSVLARGEVAILIWGLFNINELSILAMTFSIWLINLGIPAILGVIFILNSNILKSLGYVKN